MVPPEDRVLRVSVTELAAAGAAGPAFAGTALGHGRMLLGQQVHDRYRARMRRRHPGYRQEVTVRYRTELRGRQVLVEGRADGVIPGNGAGGESGLVVQEIKSVLAPDLDGAAPAPPGEASGGHPAGGGGGAEAAQVTIEDLIEDLPDPVLEAYRWQCALYCHLIALGQESPEPLRGELVLVDVRTLQSHVLDVAYDPEACAGFLKERIEALLVERAEAERLARVRREVAAEVAFPFAELRPHQQSMMENVAGAADGGMGLLVSAPTGIGKTAAALVPMVRSALKSDRRLMVVTAKVSQQEVALATLERMVPAGREVIVAQMEARERSCPREEMLCSVHACPLLRNLMDPAALAGIRLRLAQGGIFRDQDLRMLAAERRICPFEVGLYAAGIADVTVCDFNYAFHPQALLERFFAPGARERILLVDEAHNLPDRARDFLSPALDRDRVRELAEGAIHGAHPVFQRILEFLLDVDGFLGDMEAEAARGHEPDRPVVEVEVDPERAGALSVDAEAWLLDYLAYAKSGERRPAAYVPRQAPGSRRILDPFVSFCYDLMHFCRAAEERGDHMTALLRRGGGGGGGGDGGAQVKIFCKDPSRYLAARHRKFHSVVAMSATLEPLDFFADVTGIGRLRSHASCAFPSPFPREHRCLVVDESVSTRFRDRDGALPEACRRMADIARMRPGNYLAFFPSYALLQAAALLLRTSRPRLQVVSQSREGGARPVIEAFARAARRRERGEEEASLVGAAVIGGGLSEGVDFAGELAVGTFLFGPGLPAVTEERQLMHDYYQAEHGAGFEYAFLYPGLNRVVQAAGRVIRGPGERGVIVLFGRRFGEPRYLDLLPGYWREECVITPDPRPVVREFWARDPRGEAR